ncbi:MAG TPA: M56 family metallopeptidase [Gemmatimonadaceae bacterium]|nr:M56 family metallopeptidase [Gemmatimonadaceae bacterium]
MRGSDRIETGSNAIERDACYPAPPLLEKEHQHRRILLIAISTMLVLGTSPVFGHHLAAGMGELLAGRHHIFSLCLVALHLLLAPVHDLFHILIVGGALYATWDRVRAFGALRSALGQASSNRVRLAGPLLVAARVAGVHPSRLRVVDGLPNPAFTAGFWRPRIFVAASLPEILDGPQLASVLAHEKAHMDRRDPLRLSLLRFLACTLFFLPALRRLADDVADEAEIAADDAAAQGGALQLASAIMAFIEHRDLFRPPEEMPAYAAVGFQRDDLLERRVRRLLGEAAPVKSHVTRRSLTGAAAALSAVLISGLVMTHPLPAETSNTTDTHGHPSHSSHCVHHNGLPFKHLFCLGGGIPVSAVCPHANP